MKVKRVKVMWDKGRGMRWYWAWTLVDENDQPVGYPQATKKQAINYYRKGD